MSADSPFFSSEELEYLAREDIRAFLCASVSREDLVRHGFLLFGAGAHSRIILPLLLGAGLPPAWIVDGNPALVGTCVEGIPVRGKESLSESGDRHVLLGSRYVPDMLEDCRKYGAVHPLPLTAVCSFVFLPASMGLCPDSVLNNPQVEEAYALMSDDFSRTIYRNVIRFQCLFCEDLFAAYDKNIYFPADLAPKIDYSRFVDAGAFTGDTLLEWLRYCRHARMANDTLAYWGFEPGSEQFAQLRQTVQGIPSPCGIAIYPVALGAVSRDRTIAGKGAATTVTGGNDQASGTHIVREKRLDDIEGVNPTFLKADVEGFELPLLEGALSVISRCRPALGISVYHRVDDLWKIPLWIKRHCPDYSLYLRHHTPAWGDTVLYAIPPEGSSGRLHHDTLG